MVKKEEKRRIQGEIGGRMGQLEGKAGEGESGVEFSSISSSLAVYLDKHITKNLL